MGGRILSLFLLTASLLGIWGQSTASSLGKVVSEYPLILDATKADMVSLLSRFEGRDVVVKLSAGTSLLVRKSSDPRDQMAAINVGEPIVTPFSATAAGRWTFVGVRDAGGVAGRLVDLASGAVKPVVLNGTPWAAALAGDRLAVLGGQPSAPVLSIYACSTAELQQSIPVSVTVGPTRPWFTGADRLLLVDVASLYITPVVADPNRGWVGGSRIQLSGSDVTDVLSWRPPGKPVGHTARVQAHFTSRNGNDVFVLHGDRVVEFDSNGRQLSAYRLGYTRAKKPAETMMAMQGVAEAGPEAIVLLSADGILHEFVRP